MFNPDHGHTAIAADSHVPKMLHSRAKSRGNMRIWMADLQDAVLGAWLCPATEGAPTTIGRARRDNDKGPCRLHNLDQKLST